MSLFNDSYSAVMAPGLRGVTIGDVVRGINEDSSMVAEERFPLVGYISSVADNNMRTPVSAIATGVAGAAIARTAGKYFGMSGIGKNIATAAGYGLGTMLGKRLFGSSPVRNNHGFRTFG